ncbi:hypothetical protein KRP22_000979 [Phytophthora ramorum]|uniref:uncharacterized protein n=1 Tax=Phytophthora ramorum TaxID=164328 RepID=UPI003097A66C|nr:hypothetical protein KRP23_7725 [Phytophthora ramorum]KAH7508771.1 hypothetical protein KRP22_284 [Phytophthora ramorum]
MIPAAQPLPQTAADIPQRSYAPMKNPSTGVDTTNAQCAHCRKGLMERDIVKQPQCGHLFHAHCLDSHLRTDVCCPVCKVQLLFPTVTTGSVYPSAHLPPRAVPVATTFAPVDGTNARDYAACRGCGQMFYRDPRRVRPETSGWYRCERCADTNIVDFMRGSCVLQ